MKHLAGALLILALFIGSAQASAAGTFEVHSVLQVFVIPAEIPIPGGPCEGGELPPDSALVDNDFASVTPPRFKKIRSAVNWVGAGYTIYICAGEYHEHVEIERDNLHLIGEGADVTTVDGRAPKKGDVFEIEDADGIEIEGLTIQNGKNGIEAAKSSDHSFHDNVFRDNDDGIELEKPSGVSISDNDFISNGDGISIEESGSAGNSITENQFSGNRRGIVLEEADGIRIEMNVISTGDMDGTHGILLESSDNNEVIGNHISEKTWGIELADGSQGNRVGGNLLNDNEVAILLRLKRDRENTISLNTIQANEIGILQKKNDGRVGRATIYHNSFLSNDDHAKGDQLSSNQWDIGYDCAAPDGGNFWDDHTSPDALSGPNQNKLGSDQIVDEPRNISSGAEDRYPFVAQDGWIGFDGVNCGDPIITLGTDPPAIPADGASTTIVTAVAVDELGQPVPDGTILTFTTTRGAFFGVDQHVEAATTGGQTAVTLVSGMDPGSAIVTAVAHGDFGQIQVEFTDVLIEESPTPIPEPAPDTQYSVRPILECVADNGEGSYTAHFGYVSDEEEPVEIAIGPPNRFDPAPEDRGQPTVLEPGRSPIYPDSAFTVEFDGGELAWTLGGGSVTASDDPALRCSEPDAVPEPEPTPTAVPEFEVKINFQPGWAPVPDGYLMDSGEAFGERGNGYSYGWDGGIEGAEDRESADSPDQRYDTLIAMQSDATWEIAVAPGNYLVYIVAGDPSYTDSVYRILVEGALAIDGTPSDGTYWFGQEVSVEVTDGNLTVSNAQDAVNNKISFIKIQRVEQ